ncbi:MAG: hypothetical protein WC729_26465 [Sphingomonas sp.]|jgi:hypothetical protein|uniref:hypothetical protein n=1 Tax=Sphingomonas sp. TaxID=28214 RepID=UPI0035664B34
MQLKTSLFVVAMLLCGSSAIAQSTASAPPAAPAPELKPGTVIFDPAGAEVGTIESLAGEAVVVSTGTNKVTLSAKSFGNSPKGPVLGMTKTQLDSAATQAAAETATALKSKLVPGAVVHGVGGTNVVGTVKEAADTTVDVTTARGDVRLPIGAFSLSAAGAIIIGMSSADFDAAVAAARK